MRLFVLLLAVIIYFLFFNKHISFYILSTIGQVFTADHMALQGAVF